MNNRTHIKAIQHAISQLANNHNATLKSVNRLVDNYTTIDREDLLTALLKIQCELNQTID